MIYPKRPRSLESIQILKPKELPRAGRLWEPIRHSLLLSTISKEGRGLEWKFASSRYYASNNGLEMVGGWDIWGPPAPYGIQLSLGVLNSNEQESSLRFYGGVRIPKYEELENSYAIVLSEHIIGRHVRGDLKEKVRRGLNEWVETSRSYEGQLKELASTRITVIRSEKLLCQAARLKIIPWSRISRVDREFRSLKSKDQSLFNLLKPFSKTIQMNPPMKQMRQLLDFYKLLRKEIPNDPSSKQ